MPSTLSAVLRLGMQRLVNLFALGVLDAFFQFREIVAERTPTARLKRSRKDFTPSERVAIGLAVEAELKAQGERRGRPKQGGEDIIVDNYPQFEAGQKTREIAADKAGFGSEFTYRQAKTVSVLIWRVRIFRKILRNIQAVAHCGARLKSLFEEQAKQRQYRYSRFSSQRGSLLPKWSTLLDLVCCFHTL